MNVEKITYWCRRLSYAMHVEGFLSNWKTLVGGMNWRNFLYPLLLCGKLNFASSQETSISAVSVFVKAISISSYL